MPSLLWLFQARMRFFSHSRLRCAASSLLMYPAGLSSISTRSLALLELDALLLEVEKLRAVVELPVQRRRKHFSLHVVFLPFEFTSNLHASSCTTPGSDSRSASARRRDLTKTPPTGLSTVCSAASCTNTAPDTCPCPLRFGTPS